jgi:hypothetical protein
LRARRRFWSCAIAIAVIARGSGIAAQAQARVVLISPGPELEDAARAALEPWQVEIVVLDTESPGATAPHANEVARAIALEHAANAVVWVSAHDQGYALWVYDLASQRVIERRLNTQPPFDQATAAAVALSVKTLLRHSATAPQDERYGAANVAEDEDEVLPAAAPVADASAPGPDERVVHTSETPRVSPANAPRRSSELDVAVSAGLGMNLTDSGSAISRFGAAVVWWPRAQHFGAGVSLLAGPGMRISEPALSGRLVDTTASAAFHARSDPQRALRLSAAAGAGLHVIALDGALPSEASHPSVTRVAPALELSVRVDYWIASELFVGVRGGAALLLRTERYFVREERVLELSRVAFDAGLALGFSLPD